MTVTQDEDKKKQKIGGSDECSTTEPEMVHIDGGDVVAVAEPIGEVGGGEKNQGTTATATSTSYQGTPHFVYRCFAANLFACGNNSYFSFPQSDTTVAYLKERAMKTMKRIPSTLFCAATKSSV